MSDSVFCSNPDKDILFKDLDHTTININPYLVFLFWYFFNALFVLPCFIIKISIQIPIMII
mgnify:CR=1 FL=1|jgi:hypothetical protein